MKPFYDTWTQDEIDEYVRAFNIVVLFDIRNTTSKIAGLKVYGNVTLTQRDALLDKISHTFSGVYLSDAVCNKINEFAEKWYNKEVLRRRARVINIKRK